MEALSINSTIFLTGSLSLCAACVALLACIGKIKKEISRLALLAEQCQQKTTTATINGPDGDLPTSENPEANAQDIPSKTSKQEIQFSRAISNESR